MGINKKSEQALKDLKNTLRKYSHIEEVHFTAEGEHYFSCHEYAEPIIDELGKQKGKKQTRKYGFLRSEMKVARVVGERKFFKSVSVETPKPKSLKLFPGTKCWNMSIQPMQAAMAGKLPRPKKVPKETRLRRLNQPMQAAMAGNNAAHKNITGRDR
ncbi:hypothetical protein [Paraflavitalea speifideaquila]|uniref:hypothetical protein n=1 Tax=Paraflavitalea speifideaquila TaxID=3076558 RepID=UPI0028EC2CE6|nr:hypothetical protein [Paraflavitalea speifideiaquila]